MIVFGGKVTVRGNSIFANIGLGIDIFPYGVMANDDCDTDTGTNNLQNYPVITSATSSGNQTIIKGTLNSTPNTSFAVEFFVNAACNASGSGEGQMRVGGAQLTTGSDCQARFEISVPIAVPAGQFITATATDSAGNTSEFSMCAQVNTSADVTVTQTTSANQVNGGDGLIYTITVRNNGPDAAGHVIINDNLPADLSIVSCSSPQANSCRGFANNRTSALGSLAVGASATVTFFTKVNCNVTDGAQISNTASGASSTSDPTPANNIAGANVTVAIAQSTISPISRTFEAAGGFGVVNVASSGNCGWTAKSNDNFIVIGDGGSQLGAGKVRYYVYANTSGSPRAGAMTIAGQTFTVTQSAGSVNPVPTPTPSAFGPCAAPRFRATASYPVGRQPAGMASGDFNGDMFPDMAVTNQGATQAPGGVSILLNNGAGGFRAAGNYSAGTTPISVAAGDFNRDGKLDLAVANRDSADVSVLTGNGDGTFGAAKNFGAGASARFVTTADFNRDGRLDLAVANGLSNNVSILLGDGGGGFGAAMNYPTGSSPLAIAVADFNGDGSSDLVVATVNSAFSVLLGNGAGGFTAGVDLLRIGLLAGIASGDFNGDGKTDLVVATAFTSSNILILPGNGTGGFGAPDFTDINNIPGGGAGFRTSPNAITVADVNADGRADLLTANRDGTVMAKPTSRSLMSLPTESFL